MEQKNKVALIFGQYNHPVQPYLANWSHGLEAMGISIGIFDHALSNNTGAITLGSRSSNKKFVQFIKYIIRWPSHFFKWISKPSKILTLRRKASFWADFAPLIAFQPNIVHLVNSFLYPKYSDWIGKLNSSIIVSFRGFDTVVRPHVDENWQAILKDLFVKADHSHFVSEYLRSEGEKLGAIPAKSVVIYPSVDTRFFMPASDPSREKEGLFILLTVGRLTWQKGYTTAIKAVKILTEKGISIKYWIVGSGDEEGHLHFLINNWSLENVIDLKGPKSQNEIKEMLSRCDLYVQPSVTEAISVSIMEAGAMAKPVIASNVGGIPEIIIDGFNGKLIPPNDPDSLAEEIEKYINQPGLRNVMGENGRKLICDKFSIDREVAQWVELYNNL